MNVEALLRSALRIRFLPLLIICLLVFNSFWPSSLCMYDVDFGNWKTQLIRWHSYAKLHLGLNECVNESVNVCVCVCCIVMNWRHIQGVFLPHTQWIGSRSSDVWKWNCQKTIKIDAVRKKPRQNGSVRSAWGTYVLFKNLKHFN